MKITLVELDELTGNKLAIYSVLTGQEDLTLFDKFIDENSQYHTEELMDIISRMETMAHHTGLRDDFIKKGEAGIADGIEAIYDKPESKLRLYYIRFGNVAIVLGGGGPKPKNIRSLQEDPKLAAENYFLRKVSAVLREAVTQGTLRITDEGFISNTGFIYEIEEDE